MKRIATFSIFSVAQPDEAKWEDALRFAAERKWRSLGDVMLRATAEVGTPEYRELREGLDELRAKSGIESSEDVEEIPDESDREVADFVWILGVRVDGVAVRSANRRPVRCPRCGSTDPRSDYRASGIHDELLDGPAAVGDDILPPERGGWDFVNLSNELIVSARVTQWFRDWNVKGWETRPLRSAATGEPSKRASLLLATEFLPTPCLQHTEEHLEVCPACGVVRHGAIHATFWMRKKDVDHLSLWSRSAERSGQLYLHRTVADRLRDSGAHGLLTEECVRVCDHE